MKTAWTLGLILICSTAAADWPEVVSATARIITPGTAVVYAADMAVEFQTVRDNYRDFVRAQEDADAPVEELCDE